MKLFIFLSVLILPSGVFAQKHTPLPHGMVYGTKPNTLDMMDASKVEVFMDKRTRIMTTLRGKVLSVTKQKGGWFNLEAGNGKVIAAHFRDYNINIPLDMKGRTVIVEGIAQKQLIADDLQHFAGDTVVGKKEHNMNPDPKRKLTFEVKGLMVD